jgi:D-alanyl-D-alanine carboxypeptidase
MKPADFTRRLHAFGLFRKGHEMKRTILPALLIALVMLASFGAQAQDSLTLSECIEALDTLALEAAQTPPDVRALAQSCASPDEPALLVRVTTPDGIWAAAAGEAAPGVPAAPEDCVRIASVSKLFVAVSALLMAEDGLFALDDPATRWLPREIIDNIPNAGRVTLRQLLQMRSGIDDYLGTDAFWEAISEDPTRIWTAAEALTYGYGLPALFPPGTAFSYSNSNYLLMQLAMERAAGMPLHQIVRERLLTPLALTSTSTQVFEPSQCRIVRGYEDFDGDGRLDDVTDVNDGAGLGDGALISNTSDLTTFYRAVFLEQRVLSEDSLAQLLDFQPTGDGGRYSLALEEWQDADGEPSWGHSGAVTGYLSYVWVIPERETIAVILSSLVPLESEDDAEE